MSSGLLIALISVGSVAGLAALVWVVKKVHAARVAAGKPTLLK